MEMERRGKRRCKGRLTRTLVIDWLGRKGEKGLLAKWENSCAPDRAGVNKQEELVWLTEGDGIGFSGVLDDRRESGSLCLAGP